MKKVYVVRHADKDPETGDLTDEGRARAKKLKHNLGRFDIVITKDKPRLKETAVLLSDINPNIDTRAGFSYLSPDQREKISIYAKNHPMNHAGVLFEHPEFEELVEVLGKKLIELIKETLAELPEDGKALIVSQDGVMVAAERVLLKKPYQKLESSYQPLGGFIVNEKLQVEDFA